VTFRALSDDGLHKKLFEEYLVHLLQIAKDKDRKFTIMSSSLKKAWPFKVFKSSSLQKA